MFIVINYVLQIQDQDRETMLLNPGMFEYEYISHLTLFLN